MVGTGEYNVLVINVVQQGSIANMYSYSIAKYYADTMVGTGEYNVLV